MNVKDETLQVHAKKTAGRYEVNNSYSSHCYLNCVQTEYKELTRNLKKSVKF